MNRTEAFLALTNTDPTTRLPLCKAEEAEVALTTAFETGRYISHHSRFTVSYHGTLGYVVTKGKPNQDPPVNSVAIEHLQGATTFAARFALGAGVDPERVALILESLANAIRNPGDVAENMTPITLVTLDDI